MISNVAGLYLGHDFSRVVRLTIGGNFAHNESAPVHSFTVETIRGSAVLDYKLTPSTKLSLTQEYRYWDGSVIYDRYITTLALSTEWM